MNPGSNPLPALAPPASAPTDQSPPVGRGHSEAARICRALGRPVRVFGTAGSPALVVQRFKFLRFDRDSGCVVDAPAHFKPNSRSDR